jgi:hypothetical protein
MRELFNDILKIEGVKGLLLISFSGEVLFRELHQTVVQQAENRNWNLFIESLAGIRETDLIFAKGRLYIRRTDVGYVVILIGSFVSIALLRLQCDILLPSLKPAKSNKGIRRFFKKS